MATQNQIREDITNQIVAAIEAGTPPWRQPWSSHENAGAPTNASTKRRYSGVNPMVLQLSAAHHGFCSKYWATFRQWQQLGGQVKRRPSNVPSGRWGTNVVFYKPITTTKVNSLGIEEETTFPILRTFTLFNADQCDGVDQFQCRGEVSASDFIDYAPADEVIAATPADIRFGGDRAFYNKKDDFIQMPVKGQFKEVNEFYGTAFHELAHWSECRLGWKNTYALGELRAEIAACYLLSELNVPMANDLTNHHAYLANWLGAIKADPRLIFQVASAASKASDYVLSFSRQEVAVDEEVAA